MRANGISLETFRASRRGIQRQIDRRTWRMNGLVEQWNGVVHRFYKPNKKKFKVINEGLRLYREVQKLKQIKQDLKDAYERGQRSKRS